MAQRIVTLCDAHMHNDDGTEAAGVAWEVTITAPGAKPMSFSIDLCDDDSKPLRDLQQFLADVGRVATGQQTRKAKAKTSHGGGTGPSAAALAGVPTEGPIPCPVDGCDMSPASPDALQSHLRSHHDTSVAEVYGLPTPYACDWPECERKFTHPQGLGAHRKQAHGVAGTTT